jgi:hypothetical protein
MDLKLGEGGCEHDELKFELPDGEEGFDLSFNLLVQTKPSDEINVAVSQDSIARIYTHSTNAKNQIKPYIYQDNGNGKTDELLAWGQGSATTSTLFHLLKAKDTGYKLQLEYATKDMNDECPLSFTRIAIKPIADMKEENLKCYGKSFPPAKVEFVHDDDISEGEYSIPYSSIKKGKGDWRDGLEYDIELDFSKIDPSAEYKLDIEARSDFLTGQLTFELLYHGPNKNLEQLGYSERLKTEPRGQMVQRLKFKENLKDADNIKTALLRLKFPPQALEAMKMIEDSGRLK